MSLPWSEYDTWREPDAESSSDDGCDDRDARWRGHATARGCGLERLAPIHCGTHAGYTDRVRRHVFTAAINPREVSRLMSEDHDRRTEGRSAARAAATRAGAGFRRGFGREGVAVVAVEDYRLVPLDAGLAVAVHRGEDAAEAVRQCRRGTVGYVRVGPVLVPAHLSPGDRMALAVGAAAVSLPFGVPKRRGPAAAPTHGIRI